MKFYINKGYIALGRRRCCHKEYRICFSNVTTATLNPSKAGSTIAKNLNLSFKDKIRNGPSLSQFIEEELPEQRYAIPEIVRGPRQKEIQRLPKWLKSKVPTGTNYHTIKKNLRELNLHTVCEEARCPNIGECWGGGEHGTATATIMLMGDTCTRGCRFCSVKTSNNPLPLDPKEPVHVAQAIAKWGLDYVVLTSVDRDDLLDGGSEHFALTVRKLKEFAPKILVETLTGDFGGKTVDIRNVVDSGVDVYAHNLETVERCTPFVRDRRAKYWQSLQVLKEVKEYSKGKTLTKSSLMVGLGETDEEMIKAMQDLRNAGCNILTIGQYMRPTKRHMQVDSYITPETFAAYGKIADKLGFLYCASGPLVRSSYKAGEYFIKNILQEQRMTSSSSSA